jgi:hypothetical protein
MDTNHFCHPNRTAGRRQIFAESAIGLLQRVEKHDRRRPNPLQ